MAVQKKAAAKAAKSPPKPKTCQRCNHAVSFHQNATGACLVAGCTCAGWMGPKPTKVEKKVEPPKKPAAKRNPAKK